MNAFWLIWITNEILALFVIWFLATSLLRESLKRMLLKRRNIYIFTIIAFPLSKLSVYPVSYHNCVSIVKTFRLPRLLLHSQRRRLCPSINNHIMIFQRRQMLFLGFPFHKTTVKFSKVCRPYSKQTFCFIMRKTRKAHIAITF